MKSTDESILVTILMSVYNEEEYIKESIDSILNQTYSNFEFVIFDDASTDKTVDIIRAYKDDRIQLICNKKNVGLTRNLNRGILLAKGKYIIRMDGDDISLKNRIEEQVNFMEKNPDTVLASSRYISIGKDRKVMFKGNLSYEKIKVLLFFNSVLPHPGFIFRRKIILNENILYDEKLKYAQDYDFQVRIADIYSIALIPKILIQYRISQKQISVKKYEEQQRYANVIRVKQLKKIGIARIPISVKCWGYFCAQKYSWLSNWEKVMLTFLLIKQYKMNNKYKVMDSNLFKEECILRLRKMWKWN